ncbi:hypothetical protein [Pontibacter arcticus]|uniref:Uncharacterized protein n=1 Tax=Pontibacter arcticus TaxID=2080288 RepID=A0A364RC55_9BACT|nr:hypothetical protein [Pontibacter arcticus]RAU81918.1 hypothetical protein DP923_14620 [Pontibacter arcticus]
MSNNQNNNQQNDSNKKNNDDKKAPNINPVAKQDVDNDDLESGRVGGAPSQKSGSRGAADVTDGGQDMGSSAGSH